MSKVLKDLPVGVSDWSEIHEHKMFFVDKTADLGVLVTNQRKIFLSRPRRMGKTTLISQLEDLFTNGDKNFEGTAIYQRWPEQRTYPVINFSFINVDGDNINDIIVSLQNELALAYRTAGFTSVVSNDKPNLANFLRSITPISKNNRLVFLIDEWDHLLSNNLHDESFCEALLKELRVFYNWLRTLRNVRFILVTGIMRYHSTSLFTGKDIQDISMDPRWAGLLGVTHEELISNYAPYITLASERLGLSEEQLLAKLQANYDGFCFDSNVSVKLYCPFAINKFFVSVASQGTVQGVPEFKSYWMDSADAAPAFRAYLSNKPVDLFELKSLIGSDIEVSESDFTDPVDFSRVTLRSILINAGYLTIKAKKVVPVDLESSLSPLSAMTVLDAVRDYEDAATGLAGTHAPTVSAETNHQQEKSKVLYVCGFPNLDVSSKFMEVVDDFINANINGARDFKKLNMALGAALDNGDIALSCNILNELLGGILFDAFKDAHEAFYRTVIADWLRRVFRDVREEQPNYRGRSDIEITTNRKMVIVFELKLIKDRADETLDYASDDTFAWIKDEVLEPAKVQIFDRGYGINHHNIGKPVTGVILALSQRERRIVAWRKYAPDSDMTEGWLPASDMYHKLVESKGRLVGKAKSIKATSSSSSKARGKAKPIKATSSSSRKAKGKAKSRKA